MASFRRLAVLKRHISTTVCSRQAPRITVEPASALIDQKVHLLVNGLRPSQTVTIVTTVQEKNSKFESRGVFTANGSGVVDNKYTPSEAGTYTGIKPMGLFWSINSKAGHRLFKRDVDTPLEYKMNVYDGHLDNDLDPGQLVPLATATVERWYKNQSVRRIPLKEGPFRGTIFIPEGPGPFPAIVDMYGGLVTLMETRAALLASYGYATFALCYLYADGMPEMYHYDTISYIKNATEWFSQQEYVDSNRLGMLALCYGGYLTLHVASLTPQIQTVVNICGLPIQVGEFGNQYDSDGNPWPDKNHVKQTSEGLVIKDIWKCSDPKPIPVWQHGAKILQISAIDDAQIDSKWHRFAYERVPEQFQSNFTQVFYPGAGHLIDPPYTPYCPSIGSSKERMKSLTFIPDHLFGEPLLTGGNAVDHADAQEDAWSKILDFLERNLKHRDISSTNRTIQHS